MTERPSPIEFMRQTAEADRAKENSKRQQEITSKLIENNGVFGDQMEKELSQKVCQEIFNVFGSKYESVKDMKSKIIDPNFTERQKKITKENLEVLSKAAFVAINHTFKGYSSDLITSQLTADQIDDFLPDELKGLGEHVVNTDANATEEEVKQIKEMDSLKQNSKNTLSTADQELIPIWLEQEKKAREEAEAKGEKENYKSPIWLLTPEDIADEEMQQRGKQQFHFNPPYPQWYKELSQKDQDLFRVRIRLINSVAWKQTIRNGDVEKLMANGPDISRAELKLLWEMPHFKEAVKTFIQDLFSKSSESPNLLRIKRVENKKKANPLVGGLMGEELDPSIEEKITHFQKYKEIIALKLQYPDKTDDELFKIYEKYYLTENKKGEAKKMLADNKYRTAVAAAWNFLYIGNTIESADVDRQLSPSEPISDKLRTMIHPMQKALGKWCVYKEGKIISEKEEDLKYKKVTGEEEPMGGLIAGWIKYHLKMDEIQNRTYQDSFRRKIFEGEKGYRPFPRRMATSLIEMLMVNYKDENGNLVVNDEGKGKVITMSQALLDNMENRITFDVVQCVDGRSRTKDEAVKKGIKIISHDFEGHDYDTCVGFRDSMDGCFTAYNYLTGKAKLETKKIEDWASAFDKNIPLIRQNPTKYYKGSLRPSYLNFVDNPEFLAWTVAASYGFVKESEKIVLDFAGSINSYKDSYYNTVKNIIRKTDLGKLDVDMNQVMSYLSAPGRGWPTYNMLGKIQKEISNNGRFLDRHLEKQKNKTIEDNENQL